MIERRMQSIVKDFTLYLKDGERRVVSGTTIEAALIKEDLVGDKLPSVERWDVGITDSHQWCTETKMWYRTKMV